MTEKTIITPRAEDIAVYNLNGFLVRTITHKERPYLINMDWGVGIGMRDTFHLVAAIPEEKKQRFKLKGRANSRLGATEAYALCEYAQATHNTPLDDLCTAFFKVYAQHPRFASGDAPAEEEAPLPAPPVLRLVEALPALSDDVRDDFETSADKRPVVDSRTVAARFERRHDHVLRDIKALLKDEAGLAPNFGEFKNNDLTGEHTSHFLMDRTGFSLLAMGFTGAKAVKWKLAYIQAFDAMEAHIKAGPSTPTPALNDPAALRSLLLGYTEKVLALESRVTLETGRRHREEARRVRAEEQIEEMEPSVAALECISAHSDSVHPTAAAKSLGLKPGELIQWLLEHGWTFRRFQQGGSYEDTPYQKVIERGFLEIKYYDKDLKRYRPTNAPWRRPQIYVTGKGLAELARIFACEQDRGFDLLRQPPEREE